MHRVIYLIVHLCGIDALLTANSSGERRQQSTGKTSLSLTSRCLSSPNDLLYCLLSSTKRLRCSHRLSFPDTLGICKLPSTFLHTVEPYAYSHPLSIASAYFGSIRICNLFAIFSATWPLAHVAASQILPSQVCLSCMLSNLYL